jgi:hypothetical protein
MRRAITLLFAACLVTGAAACDDEDGSDARDATATSRGSRPSLATTSTGDPPLTTGAAPEVCDTFPEWLGPSTSAVVRRTEGSASCEEVAAVAREFFFTPGAPTTGTAQGWECTRDPVGVDHVGDCVGPNGRLAVDVSRPGDA